MTVLQGGVMGDAVGLKIVHVSALLLSVLFVGMELLLNASEIPEGVQNRYVVAIPTMGVFVTTAAVGATTTLARTDVSSLVRLSLVALDAAFLAGVAILTGVSVRVSGRFAGAGETVIDWVRPDMGADSEGREESESTAEEERSDSSPGEDTQEEP